MKVKSEFTVNVIQLTSPGANFNNGYKPQITSYDYDAPISEAGDLTTKYFIMREVILKHRGIPPPWVPLATPKKAFGNIYVTRVSFEVNRANYWMPF